MDCENLMENACRFCGRLAENEECQQCRRHFDHTPHYPKEVRFYQAPGQPRVLVRYSGACGKPL
jgi:hypothetical protein